jgi:hypothetical protein
MSVETILTRTMNEVPKALAAGVVDMSTGMLLGVKTVDSHPDEVLELVAGATKEMLEGDNVIAIENVFKKRGGVSSDQRLINEATFSTPKTLHIFERLKSGPSIVALAVCRADTNLGLALMKMRAIGGSESI